ncbi:MAG: hypothetical protein WBC44_04900 [Planctomycetaceae bacterium]
METLLADFQLDRPTWFYLSLLLIVAIYFRFARVWSLRNLDLALLLALSPGLLFVERGFALGFVWLFAASAVILARMLVDPLFERRPRLPQNLNTAGLTFLLAACALIYTAEILTTDRLPKSALQTAHRAGNLVEMKDASRYSPAANSEDPPIGPAATVFTAPAVGLSRAVTQGEPALAADLPVRIAAILAHVSLVTALVMLGWRQFGDLHLGVAMATLYLLVPCTAYNVSQVNHILPCALILWAVYFYRNPFASGGLLGLACGTLFFPVFLLPVWMTFYGLRNTLRFGAALSAVWIALLGSIAMTSVDTESFLHQVLGLIDWSMLDFGNSKSTGVWTGISPYYRMPVFALFVVMTGMLAWWPKARKVETLLARSAAVIVGTQFWYPQNGGVYLLWYVPLLLAVIFRPALSQLTPPPLMAWPWQRRSKTGVAAQPQATPAGVELVRPLFR